MKEGLIRFFPANEPVDEDAMDDENEIDSWNGNRRRKLWKKTCTRAALNVRLPSQLYLPADN